MSMTVFALFSLGAAERRKGEVQQWGTQFPPTEGPFPALLLI